MMKDDLPLALAQYETIRRLSPDGIVLFSYDDISEEIIDYVNSSTFRSPDRPSIKTLNAPVLPAAGQGVGAVCQKE